MTKLVAISGQQKWENFIETRKTETSLLAEINCLGQEGWEVVTVLYYKDAKGTMTWTAFLKRPSTGSAPVEPAAERPATEAPPEPARDPAPGPQGFDLSDDEFKLVE